MKKFVAIIALLVVISAALMGCAKPAAPVVDRSAAKVAALEKRVADLENEIKAIRDLDISISSSALQTKLYDLEGQTDFVASEVDPTFARKNFERWVKRGHLNDDMATGMVEDAKLLSIHGLLTANDVTRARKAVDAKWYEHVKEGIDALYVW